MCNLIGNIPSAYTVAENRITGPKCDVTTEIDAHYVLEKMKKQHFEEFSVFNLFLVERTVTEVVYK
jgi:hypothetical protein